MKTLAALFLICLSAIAKDKFRLSLFLAANDRVERFEDVDEDNFKGSRVGFGLLVESEKLKAIRVETGLIKASRQYSIPDQGNTIVEEVERLHIPLLIKYYRKALGFGVGPYYALSVSDEERASESNFPSTENTSAEKEESGLMYSASYSFSAFKSGDLFFDLRWIEPFTHKNAEETNNFIGLFGIKYEI